MGSTVGSSSEGGAQPVGSLACFFSFSDTQCCQLLVRLHTMLAARSFLMFLLLEGLFWGAFFSSDMFTSESLVETHLLLLLSVAGKSKHDGGKYLSHAGPSTRPDRLSVTPITLPHSCFTPDEHVIRGEQAWWGVPGVSAQTLVTLSGDLLRSCVGTWC